MDDISWAKVVSDEFLLRMEEIKGHLMDFGKNLKLVDVDFNTAIYKCDVFDSKSVGEFLAVVDLYVLLDYGISMNLNLDLCIQVVVSVKSSKRSKHMTERD